LSNKNTIFINFCSGKSGVGKSVLSSNFAYLLSEQGNKVLLLDGDCLQSMQNFIFGIKPKYGIKELLDQKIDLKNATHQINENLSILTYNSLTSINIVYHNKVEYLIELIRNSNLYDFVIIDTASELNEDLINSIKLSDIVMLIINEDPISLIDSYALLKVIKLYQKPQNIKLLINNIIDEEDANSLEHKLNSVNSKFLNLKIKKIGYIPYDRQLRTSILNQNIYVKSNNHSELAVALKKIALKIEELFFVVK